MVKNKIKDKSWQIKEKIEYVNNWTKNNNNKGPIVLATTMS